MYPSRYVLNRGFPFSLAHGMLPAKDVKTSWGTMSFQGTRSSALLHVVRVSLGRSTGMTQTGFWFYGSS